MADRRDAPGNLLKQGTCPAGTPYQYNYDAENRLKDFGPGTATYFYNNDGQRIKKVVGTTTIYVTQGITGNALSEIVNGVWTKDYIYLGGQLLATESATQGTRYHFSDHLGTPRLVVNDAGGIICSHDYYPFGQERTVCNEGETHKFTGQERDGESGLDYFGARYDSSALGRFMSPDPGSAHPDNPQSWNRYAYAMNNPLVYIDPNGLWVFDTTVGGFNPLLVPTLEKLMAAAGALASTPTGRRIFAPYGDSSKNFAPYGKGPHIAAVRQLPGAQGRYHSEADSYFRANTIELSLVYVSRAAEGSFAAFAAAALTLLHEQAHASRAKSGFGPNVDKGFVEDSFLGPAVDVAVESKPGGKPSEDKIVLVFEPILGESDRERLAREAEARARFVQLLNLLKQYFK
jgi:RHS repeat-associated protein